LPLVLADPLSVSSALAGDGGFIGAVADALEGAGVHLGALAVGWARVMPTVVLVPAFGLRALPTAARAVMGLALSSCLLGAAVPLGASPSPPWGALLVAEAARGLPVAIAAAVPLWAATMAGGVADALRGSQDAPSAPTVEGRATPLGVPMSLLACAIFLSTGGPARVVAALGPHPIAASPSLAVQAAATDLVSGITLAVALGGPLLAAAVVIEVAGALIARAASPAQVHALLAPVRAFGTLAVMALVFERLAAALARSVHSAP
jgi:flagellar biosynthesis protein FliR